MKYLVGTLTMLIIALIWLAVSAGIAWVLKITNIDFEGVLGTVLVFGIGGYVLISFVGWLGAIVLEAFDA